MSVAIKPPKYTPDKDGIDHINLYSKSRTVLGRQLSNFAHSPFKHPEYGEFASVEAFYYWLSTGKSHDHLRSLYGIHAKTAGQELEKVICTNFENEIVQAIRLKIKQNPMLAQVLAESTLPLAHYYWFGIISNCKVCELPEHDYMVEALEQLRTELKKEI
jgi:hypothetical protein